MAPRRGIALGDDVGVSLEAKGLAGLGAVKPADHIRAARGDLLHFDREPFAAEPRLHGERDRPLVGYGFSRPEDARDADQRGGEIDDLALVDLAEDSVDGEAGHLDGPRTASEPD